jgi:hypothetical protein
MVSEYQQRGGSLIFCCCEGFQIPHANIHVCHAASHLACTPFLANNNQDSSHSPQLRGNFTDGSSSVFDDFVEMVCFSFFLFFFFFCGH